MGVAVAAAFVCVLEAANAGETLGPKAVVNAVSKANIFLGAADALTRLNIFLPPSSGRSSPAVDTSVPKNGKTRYPVFRGCYIPVKGM